MTEFVLKILRILGLDRAIGYGVLARAWSIISGPLTVLIIASRYSKEQQGFFYTISSLIALQVFFELGLVNVLAQFASHEFAYLSWGPRGRIDGDSIARERLFDLLVKATTWFAIAALLLVIILVPAGLYFLGQYHGSTTNFSWRIPWILAVCGTALNLLIVPFFAIVLGSGDVVTVNHREMMGAIVSSVVAWCVIGLHGGLYAVFAITTGNILVSGLYLFNQKPLLVSITISRMLGSAARVNGNESISWWVEVWPMQWKIALSWVSGYFIFQLFNPVLFHYHGPVVAGQMGMTLSVSNVLLSGCCTWMNSRGPEFGKLIAKRNWLQLDALFYRVMRQSIVVVVAGAGTAWGLIAFLQANFEIGQRFIEARYAGLLFGAVCAQIVISGLAVYLRAHKKEPFMVLSIIAALFQGVSTWYLGMTYGAFGVTFGFLVVNGLITLPLAFLIWRRCRRKWHVGEVADAC